MLYGVVTLWLGFLAIPVSLILWLSMGLSAWWVAAGAVAAFYLVAVSRDGHCQALRVGAEKHKGFYEVLVWQGAFFFEPPSKIAQ
jgi:hypothetical protein